MEELKKRIYAQQCEALASRNLELYEVLKEAAEALSSPPPRVKVIIDRGIVQDILATTGSNCSVEVIYIDPDEKDYEEMQDRRDEIYADDTLGSVR